MKSQLQTYLTDQERQHGKERRENKDTAGRTPPPASLVGTFLQIPKLRAYYPFTSIDDAGAVYDLSGQGRTLTNNSATAFGLENTVSYGIGDGAADYFSRADEAGLSITGALSLVGWAYSDDTPAGVETLSGKWNTTGNQRSYVVRMTSTPDYRGLVSSNGTAETSVTSTVAYVAAKWFMYALVFVPSTSLSLYINENGLMVATTNVTSIPASIADGTAPFTVQANGTPGEYLDGRHSNLALANYSLSAGFVQWLFDSTRWGYGA